MYTLTGGLTRTPQEDGTLFSVTDGNSSTLRFPQVFENTPCILEFYVVDVDSQLTMYAFGGSALSTSLSLSINQIKNHMIKIKFDGISTVEIYSDTTLISTRSLNTPTNTFGFYLLKSWSVNSWNLKIKDLKIYPI